MRGLRERRSRTARHGAALVRHIILAIALFFAGIRENPTVDAAFKGMRPVVVALIIGPVISLSRGMHPALYAVIAASAVAVWHLRWSPVYVLAAAAACGIAYELFIAKETPMILLQLFLSYLKIGFLRLRRRLRHALAHTERGGRAARAWMSNAQFADIVAVSQITPAPSPSIRPPTWAGPPWDCRPAGTLWGCWARRSPPSRCVCRRSR